MNKIIKKFVAAVLSAATMLTAVNTTAFSNTVYADSWVTGDGVSVTCDYFQYTYDFSSSGLTPIFGQIPKLTANGQVAYCIDSMANSGPGGNSSPFLIGSAMDKDSTISLALAYGYIGTTKYGYSSDVEQLATQIMIWCIEDGWYNNTSEATALNYFTANMGSIASSVKDVYQKIKEQILAHRIVPSFNGDLYPMDEEGGTWTVTVKDRNGVADQFDWQSAVSKYSYLSVISVTADSITLKSTKAIDSLTLTAAKKKGKYSNFESVEAVRLIPNGGENKQESTVARSTDPPTASISLTAEEGTGTAQVVKTSDDGNVEGITIRILTSGGSLVKTLTTDSNGKTEVVELEVGNYIAVEQVPAGYEKQEDKRFTVQPDKLTTVTFENKATTGDSAIIKTFEKVDGRSITALCTFTIEAISLVSEDAEFSTVTKTISSDGEMLVEGIPEGTYRVTENAPAWYIPNAPQILVVSSGTTASASFYNQLKRGNLQVQKYSEDNILSGFTFHLYGTADCGVYVDEYATTNASGIASFNNILIGSYTIEETNIPIRYVVNDPQSIRVNWNQTATAYFENILKKFRVRVAKADIETGAAQGDASLGGAIYGLYCNGVLVDTYTTDENGIFTTAYYDCDYAGTGHEYYIQEISPSEGYLLDETKYPVQTDPGLYTIEYNTTGNAVYEQVLKGNIALIKHSDNGDTQIETPETGATFEIYLKSAGSYLNAKDTERDVLVCDSDGFAQSKDLPCGVYTVHQTSGWPGRELMEDFDVYIAQDGYTYKYLINNSIFYSYIRIVKVDAETGKTIPYAGAGFQIYNPDGSLVSMTYTYPQITTIDTFYTNADGWLITPESLIYGEGYSLVEVQAPYGYVLNSDPVYFNIVQSDSEIEEGFTIIEVKRDNMPQKGKIVISKTGEIFASVTEVNGIYQPVYTVAPLAGAVYEIYAAEDIYTLDGTLRYAKDELVETVTTGEDGTATSKEIYLGRYYVVEITAPDGYYLSEDQELTTHCVELTYKGQEYVLTDDAETAYNNDRQKAALSLLKALEQDELFGIGMNGEITNVQFGLYAAETLTAADGTTIPADGLIEAQYCAEDGTIAFKSDLPFGKYYVQEISTDEHYILNGEKFAVTFSYQGQEIAVVEIAFNDGTAIDNDMIRGKVSGEKVNLENPDEKLANALIGLFSADTTEFTAENAYLTDISDEMGAFSFEDVPFGTYIVREIAAPESFVLNENSYFVTISEEVEVIEITITDKPIYGNISLTKVDAEYPENKLSGAVFEIYKDTNKNGIFDEEDEFFDTLNESETGIYTRMHIRYGGYFVKEKTAPEGFLLDENVYYVFIAEDEVTYEIENEAGVGFADQPIKGNIELLKVDASDINVTLSGAEFTVYADSNKNGELDEEDEIAGIMIETENGIYRLEEVRYGQYFVVETKAPEGFLADPRIYPVFIEKHGATYVIRNVNARTDTEGSEAEYTDMFADIPIIGNIKLVKVDEDNHNLRLSGAIFTVYKDSNNNGEFDAEDEIVGTMTEFLEGEYIIDGLRYGRYFVTETRAPEDYELDPTVYTVFISEHGKTEYVSNVANGLFANRHKPRIPHTPAKPEIRTTATVNGEKVVVADGMITIEDVVSYKNLIVGRTYTVTGTLMDKSTGEKFLVNGEPVTAETTFTPETADGTVTVTFVFDGSGITENTDHVVFEKLYELDAEGKIKDKPVAEHEDINDKDQTVTVLVPEIKTNATADGGKEVFAGGMITIEDVVSYKNLVVGREYTVTGTLMDKSTGEAFLVNGEPVTAETTFIPETADGTVIVTFTFDASAITENTDLVVFEKLFELDAEGKIKDEPIAEHEDIEDEDQTVIVLVPEIGTTATVEGKKEAKIGGTVTIEDVVSYKNFIVGKEYVIKGILMDKSTGEAFLVDGQEVTAETTFIPETADGTVVVTFVFDTSAITANTDIVVFESLYERTVDAESNVEDKLIARHTDITDEDQTVTLLVPNVPETPDDNVATGVTLMPNFILAAAAAALLIIITMRRRKKNG